MKRLFIFNFVIFLSPFFFHYVETFGQVINEHTTNQIDYKVKLEKGDAGIYLEGNCRVGKSCGSGLEIYIFDAEKKSFGGVSIGCNYKEDFDDFGNVIRQEITRCNLDDNLFIVPKTGIYTLSVVNQAFSKAGFTLSVFQNVTGADRELLRKSLTLQDANTVRKTEEKRYARTPPPNANKKIKVETEEESGETQISFQNILSAKTANGQQFGIAASFFSDTPDKISFLITSLDSKTHYDKDDALAILIGKKTIAKKYTHKTGRQKETGKVGEIILFKFDMTEFISLVAANRVGFLFTDDTSFVLNAGDMTDLKSFLAEINNFMKQSDGNSGAPPKSAAANVSSSVNVQVSSDSTTNGWTNSGIVVRKGQRIRISATGQIFLGGQRFSTPEGIVALPDSDKLISTEPTGGLIAVIGNDNNDFYFIGKSREFIAQRSGELFLGINEGYLNDNKGNFNVIIQVEK